MLTAVVFLPPIIKVSWKDYALHNRKPWQLSHPTDPLVTQPINPLNFSQAFGSVIHKRRK